MLCFVSPFTEANRLRDAQSIRSRLALRDRLKCNDFNWYLKNVWPENFFPAPDRFFGKVPDTLHLFLLSMIFSHTFCSSLIVCI